MQTDRKNNIEKTDVVIIGAGVAGLTLATFFKRFGIEVVILERRDRAYIEFRQRAGVVDARAVRMFEEWDWPISCWSAR